MGSNMSPIINCLPEIIINELRALMFVKFCGYERIQVDIEFDRLSWAYRILVRSLVTDLRKYLWFDADNIKNDKFRHLEYYHQLGLNWADPIC